MERSSGILVSSASPVQDDEGRRDAQQGAVGVLQQEGRRGRVPGRVAAGLERRADATGREGGGVGFALDELLARRSRPSPSRRPRGRRRSRASRRWSPVSGWNQWRVVSRAASPSPSRFMALSATASASSASSATHASPARPAACLKTVFGQPLALDGLGENDVGAVDLGEALLVQVDRLHGAAVGTRLRGVDVGLPACAAMTFLQDVRVRAAQEHAARKAATHPKRVARGPVACPSGQTAVAPPRPRVMSTRPGTHLHRAGQPRWRRTCRHDVPTNDQGRP